MLKNLSLATLNCLFAVSVFCQNLYGSEQAATFYESSIPLPVNTPAFNGCSASIPIPTHLPQATIGSIPLPINIPTMLSLDSEATIPAWPIPGKVYLNPEEIELSEEGIFVFLDDHLLEVDGLHVDQGGIYAYAGEFRCLGCHRPVNTKYICENARCVAYDSP
ncbi:MAG: hypothetical protein KDK55_00365 [Chlamydiia bacterium]|nr:hypothetical protein [Chlamydiia bacterium]